MRFGPAAVLLLIACGPDVPLPDHDTTSRWVHYHHWESEEPCPEVLEQLDAQIDFMQKVFELGSIEPVDYFKYRQNEENLTAKLCSRFGSVGCTLGKTSYGTGWAENHELVHAVWDQLGYPPQIFIEGIAVVLGCGETGYSGQPIPLDLDVEALIDSNTWNASFSTNGASNYAVAGSLVRWLIDRSGSRTFANFYRSAGGMNMNGAHKAFQETYGITFQDAVAQWKASSPGPEGSFCLVPHDPCDSPAMLDSAEGRTSLTRSLSCIPQVITVAAGDGEAMAAAVSASERPITAVLEACVARSRFEPVVAPPELFGRSPSTPGKDLELRSFGLGAKGRLRVTPARNADRMGAMLDPQGSAFGGDWGGELTAHTLESAGVLFSSGCPAQTIPIGPNAWAVQLTGDLEVFSATPGAALVAFSSPTPYQVAGLSLSNIAGGIQCGGPCDPACSGGPSSDYTLTLMPRPPGQRFRLNWVLDR